MTVQQAKQAFKNTLYRSIGETSSALGLAPNDHALRVLMYHKVNDIPDNPTTVPVWRFDEQLASLRDLGYQVVGLDAAQHLQGLDAVAGHLDLDAGTAQQLHRQLAVEFVVFHQQHPGTLQARTAGPRQAAR